MEVKRSEALLVTAVSLGGVLEWYEIGLYIYWPLIILGKFITVEMPIVNAFDIGLVIATGCLARPFGGLIFGRWGDRKGRKAPFSWSVVLVSLPSLLITLLPSYMVLSGISLTLFTAVKFLQGIPAGGELPGAICYLSENDESTRRRYLCSFAFVGPQIGLLLSLVVCLLMQMMFPPELLMHTWWRMVFFVSGVTGILGFFLRRRLHDSCGFKHFKRHHELTQHPVRKLFKTHSKNVILASLLSVFQVVTFCILTIMPSWYYKNLFELNDRINMTISMATLLVCALTLPVIGKISSRYKKIPFLTISAVGVLVLTYPFYWSIVNLSLAGVLSDIEQFQKSFF